MYKQYICPLCGESLYYVLIVHAEKHEMTLDGYVKRFPKASEHLVGGRRKWGKKRPQKR